MMHHIIMSGKPGARWDTPIPSSKTGEALWKKAALAPTCDAPTRAAWLRLEPALARRITGSRPEGPGS